MVTLSYIEESLSTNEQIRGLFKLHWFEWLAFWVWLLLAPLTLGITLIVALWYLVKILTTEMGVTSRRVILKTGFISRSTEEMKLSSIETVEIRQSIMGRIFGYGTVVVTGRGISSVDLARVADPLGVKRQVENVLAESEAVPA